MEDTWTFYAAFEDRYRGSFDEIKLRVKDYIPFVLGQEGALKELTALDLGSGRGEWLSALSDHNIRGVGVDQSPNAVGRARDLGLEAQVGDIFEFLASAKNSTYRVVTAFHVIEHLPWELQLRLFTECHRVLAPGGAMIVEWPNTENILVATQTFWMDPTHIRPLPVPLAQFMAEFARFSIVNVKKFRSPSSADKPQAVSTESFIVRLSSRLLNSIAAKSDASHESDELRQLMRAPRDVALICTK